MIIFGILSYTNDNLPEDLPPVCFSLIIQVVFDFFVHAIYNLN